MKTIHQGSCACGAIGVELRGELDFVSHCHCQSCRASHGAAFVTWTGVASQHLTVSGEPATWESSAGVRRSFCATCGTPMLYRSSGVDRAYVPVAVLSNFEGTVQSHVSFEERVHWLHDIERLPCFHAKSDRPTPWAPHA